jgi:hypothetical protein
MSKYYVGRCSNIEYFRFSVKVLAGLLLLVGWRRGAEISVYWGPKPLSAPPPLVSFVVTKTPKLACQNEVCATVDDPPFGEVFTASGYCRYSTACRNVKYCALRLSVCLSVCLSVRPSVRPSVRLSVSVCPSVCLAIGAVCFPEQLSFVGLCDGECVFCEVRTGYTDKPTPPWLRRSVAA